MAVEEIIQAWLKEHGFGGLCCSPCHCFLGNLLMPHHECGIGSCQPGYRVKDEDGEWVIREDKPEEKP